MASLVFSAASVEIEERPSRQPVPKGTYSAMITESEMKEISPASNGYDASNEIKGYSAPAGAAPVAPAAPAPVAQEAAFVDDIPGGAPAKPWEQ